MHKNRLNLWLGSFLILVLAFSLLPVSAVQAATYRNWVAQVPTAPTDVQTVRVWMNSDTAMGETAVVEYHLVGTGTYVKVLGSYDNTSYPGANWYADIPALPGGTQVEYQLLTRNEYGSDYGFSGFNWNYTVIPTVVYVDEDFTAATPGWGVDHFAVIQDGVNAVASGGTVYVADGTYVETDLAVNKPLALLGPNAGIDPNTGMRDLEAVVLPGRSDPNPWSATMVSNLYVGASDVRIDGFTFDGDNPALTSGIEVNGADADAGEAIGAYDGSANLKIENNILRNTAYAAIDLDNYNNGGVPTSGNDVRYNFINNIGHIPYGYGIGVLLYDNFYAQVDANVIDNVRVGIQTGNYHRANPGLPASLTNNQIRATRKGIFHNLHYSSASPFLIVNNQISALEESGTIRWDGIMLSSIQTAVDVVIADNVITADINALTVGYQVWSTPTTADLTVTRGLVSGADYGVWINNWDGYPIVGGSDADNTHLTLDGVTIENASLAGVYVFDNPSEVHGHTASSALRNMTIRNSTVGLLVSGYSASATLNNSWVTGNGDAIQAANGAVVTAFENDLSGSSHLAVNNTTGALLDASGNWLGSNTPAGAAAAVSADVDYTPWLNGAAGGKSALPGFQGDFSALNVDDDSPQNGTLGRIQEGVNLAASGGTVYVAAGTYAEDVLVDKQVAIIGTGSGTTPADTIVTSPAVVDYKEGVFQITASGTAGEPVRLQDMRVLPVGQAGVSIGRFTEATATNVDYLTLDNLMVYGTNNNAQTEQERGLYVDLSSTLNHLTVIDSAFNNLAYGWYFQKVVSADTSTVSNVTVTNTTFNHNSLKGLYAEKLTDASFVDCTVSQNGFDATGLPSYFIPWMSGMDINLKAGTYQNLIFTNLTVTNNGLGGAKEGVGMGLKARSDGATYGPFPATLDNVQIVGSTFTGNERGIRVGEPGKSNPGPTNVILHHNRIYGNDQTYTGTDGSAYGGLINQSTAAVTAENNWWGCNEGPAGADCDPVFGLVDADPWVVLEAEMSPLSLAVGGEAVLNASLVKNSDDVLLTGSLPENIPAAFSAALGAFAPANIPFTGGLVSSTYTAQTSGADNACVTVDAEQICFALAVNDLPVAHAQTLTTAEDTPLAITLTATDLIPGTLNWILVDQSNLHGALTGTAPALTYTPDLNYTGPASFTFKVNDGEYDSNVATIAITVTPVNDSPVAVDDAYSTDEDVALVVAAPGVMSNDSDPDATDIWSAALLTSPAHGTLVFFSDGSFTYTPEANWSGTDSFTYMLITLPSLKGAHTDPATVVITVNPVNDPPVAGDDEYSVTEAGGLVVAAPGVLANDSDVDTDNFLYVTLLTDVTHGTLTLYQDGSFAYIPDEGFTGDDSFTYMLVSTFGKGEYTTTATVTLHVTAKKAPQIGDQTIYSAAAFGLALPESAFADVPAEYLGQVTLTAKLADGSELPTWLKFDPATATFSGVPADQDAGQVVVKVFATDPTGSYTSNRITINVMARTFLPFVGR